MCYKSKRGDISGPAWLKRGSPEYIFCISGFKNSPALNKTSQMCYHSEFSAYPCPKLGLTENPFALCFHTTNKQTNKIAQSPTSKLALFKVNKCYFPGETLVVKSFLVPVLSETTCLQQVHPLPFALCSFISYKRCQFCTGHSCTSITCPWLASIRSKEYYFPLPL